MGGYLGLDVGDKRLGIAFLDDEVRIAFPQKAVLRQEAQKALLGLIATRGVHSIIVGLPLTAEGKMTPQAAKVKKFVANLVKSGFKTVFKYVDEHLSSEDASERLRDAGLSVADARKSGALDCMVAALLLEGYIKGEIPEVKVAP